MLVCLLSALETPEEQARFTRLYERYHDRLYSIAYGMLHKRDKAEDTVQDTFVKIILHFETISELPCRQLDAWIVTILKNTVLDLLRKDRRYTDRDPAELLADLPDPSQDVEQTLACRLLLDALRQLPPDDRELLELKLVMDWSNQEIARAMGLTANAAGVRIHRARTRLREVLEKEGIL